MSWTQSKGSCWILKTNLDTFFCCFWQKCVNFHLFCWKICKYPLRSFKNPLLSFQIQWDPSNSIGSYWILFGPISDSIGSNRILSFKTRPDRSSFLIEILMVSCLPGCVLPAPASFRQKVLWETLNLPSRSDFSYLKCIDGALIKTYWKTVLNYFFQR